MGIPTFSETETPLSSPFYNGISLKSLAVQVKNGKNIQKYKKLYKILC